MSKYGIIRLRAGTTARASHVVETCAALPFDDKDARVTFDVDNRRSYSEAGVTLRIQRQKAKHTRVGSADLSLPLLIELTTQALLRSDYPLSPDETKQLLLAICSGMARPAVHQSEE